MTRFLVSILLLVLLQAQPLLRLSTEQTSRLNVDQALFSTLGLFKATLRRDNCSLQIQAFNETNNNYSSKGFHRNPNASTACSFLEVQEGRIVTSAGQEWMIVGSSFNQSTIFTIDDLGVLRLIGTYVKLNRVDQESFETNIQTYYTPQKYIYVGSNLNVKFTDSFGPLTNENNWVYLAEFGQLDIYFNENPQLTKSYVYSRFKFNNSQIEDFNSNTFPAAIFSNITFEPRCFEPRTFLNFKPPFIIKADPYWPRATVMEQGGYKVFELDYAKRSEFSFKQTDNDLNYLRQFSICPEETFQHKGKCLVKCPEPYFHEMRGTVGSCRLICEEYTPTNSTSRICSCMSDYLAQNLNKQYVRKCPTGSQQYPYGCFCTGEGQFFDKTYTFSCVTECPTATYGHEGLCVDCPEDCQTCQEDNFHRRFLECTACRPGFYLEDGQCFQECNTNLGKSMVEQVCQQCQDPNCVDCSNDTSQCKQCGLLFALYNGSCLKKCPQGTQQVAYDVFGTRCMPQNDPDCQAYLTTHFKDQAYLKCDSCLKSRVAHLDGCVDSCPLNYSLYEYQGFSYCVCSEGLTINDKCEDLPNCPIKMSYDIFSGSCLSCPFGCLSCKGSICTSCYPGYFLYVSPQAIICRRESPLFACEDQYGLWNGICLVKEFKNLQMTQCQNNIAHCKVCPFKRNDTCVACEEGFYLLNNSCVSQCPARHVIYQNSVCLMVQIQNCQRHFLDSQRQSAIINISYIENNEPYKYYIFNNIEPANDPVGYIPYFQKITSSRRVTDGLFRQNSFFEPSWKCLKCEDGYGLTSDHSQCIPCPTPCLTCYMASNISCLTVEKKSNQSCNGYVDFTSKICLQSCNSTSSYPQLQDGILYCMTALQASVGDVVRIDSAIYSQGDGSKVAYFVFENEIPEEVNVTVTIKKNNEIPRVQKNSKHALLRTLQTQGTEKNVEVKGRYFQVLAGNGDDAFIVNFTSSIYSLKSVEGYFPPNLVYGSTVANTHPEFMKTWLAIIGQIMGLVIMAMHCIYVGNQLLYKMDNLLILAQTIYYFSFVKVLVGRLLAQFYYGWIYAHLGFFPNFFTTPDQYRQNEAPISYKLATTDANFIRNAGYSISIFLVFLGAWALVSAVCYLISKRLHRRDIWHPQLCRNSIIAVIQLLSMNVFYWAVAHLMYRGDCQNCDDNYHRASMAWAILFIVLICLYSLGRAFYNPIGSLYMAKRVLIATILPAAFEDYAFIAPLLVLQALFVLLRFVLERPSLAREKLSIVIQFGAVVTVYLLLFLCSNAGVNTIIISIIVFAFIVALMSDYVQVYLESVNQWEAESENRQEQVKSGMERAHTDLQLGYTENKSKDNR